MIAAQWRYFKKSMGTTLSSDTVGTLLACQSRSQLVRQDNNVTALFLPVSYSDLEIVDLLLNSNADVAARDYEGRTALYNATDMGDAGIMERLLQRGSSVTEREYNLFTMNSVLTENHCFCFKMNAAEKMIF